jgi:hypothetical protein
MRWPVSKLSEPSIVPFSADPLLNVTSLPASAVTNP